MPRTPKSHIPTVSAADVQAIVGGYHGAPHDVLGPHVVIVNDKAAIAIRVFRPLDERVIIKQLITGKRTEMSRIDEAGFFEAIFTSSDEPFGYRLIVMDGAGDEIELEDPYRFPFLLTDYDLYLFNEGNFFKCYEKMGAHFRTIEMGPEDIVRGVNFAVWAPNAERISVSGEHDGWDKRAHPMTLRGGTGVWELFIPDLVEGAHYKYRAALERGRL